MNVGKTPVWQQRQRESPLPCKPTAPSYLEKVCVSFSLNRVDPWERDMERNPSVSSIHKGPWEDSKFKLLEEKELLSAPWKLPLELSNNVNSEKESNSPEKKKGSALSIWNPKFMSALKWQCQSATQTWGGITSTCLSPWAPSWEDWMLWLGSVKRLLREDLSLC